MSDTCCRSTGIADPAPETEHHCACNRDVADSGHGESRHLTLAAPAGADPDDGPISA
ncbi:hypothetical protein Celgi_0140 [Cellulomonas gilvus ATCC 13127]|uniref:Uncharacterized protein n=1 Tax=Cellulomonas gilvus (strain ATCC 13127 / NRRL B-14078) TaxID=593907 RepID=F8A2V3_CELGA|nr:hypothetical protein Celgi_0140 [Cellulomonas gilvus ATCC 13127]